MNKLGSNQHRLKPKYKFWSAVWIIPSFLLIVAFLGHLAVSRSKEFISPIPRGYIQPIIKVVYAKDDDNIPTYIRHVFGDKADEALKIVGCESKFNPKAIGDGGKSIGLFQIHTTWHKIEPRFLKNFKINTQVAYQLFKESGNSWNLWSCKNVL